MSVGDAATIVVALIIVVLGGRAVARQTWDAWLKPLASKVLPPKRSTIMLPVPVSSQPSQAPSLETDAKIEEVKPIAAPVVKAATLDTCKSLRAHGFNREEARELLRELGWGLNNNVWAKAQPDEDENQIVTPYAGRVTNKKFYPDQPELEYQELAHE